MRRVALWCLAIGLCGCTPSVSEPHYSAAEIANAAMAAYDTNKDGKLDEKELEQCPALQDMFNDPAYHGDKAISRDYLEKYFKDLLESKIALTAVNCKVFDGQGPMAQVELKFVPEKFYGGALRAGAGKTDEHGAAGIRIEGQPAPGLAPGFYRVELSKKDAAGKETIPAEYNVRTTLGYQVRLGRKSAIKIEIP